MIGIGNEYPNPPEIRSDADISLWSKGNALPFIARYTIHLVSVRILQHRCEVVSLWLYIACIYVIELIASLSLLVVFRLIPISTRIYSHPAYRVKCVFQVTNRLCRSMCMRYPLFP